MTGIDTGFFVKLLRGDNNVKRIFEDFDDDIDLCVSCLTLFELKRLSLKGALVEKAVDELIANITALAHVSWLDNVDIHYAAASLSHGLGIPAVDSLILAGFILNDSEIIYTTDSHMEMYMKKGVKVIRI